MIPDEAVEAALKAQLSFKSKRGLDNDANLMRHILEAAAPHLKAQAWDECEAAKYEIRLNPGSNAWEPVKDNPCKKGRDS